MVKKHIKKILAFLGINTEALIQQTGNWSLNLAAGENRRGKLVEKLRGIVPDITNQECSTEHLFNAYWEFKRRSLQAFQCALMLQALQYFSSGKLRAADIGDSAGTHMLYLKELAKDKFTIDTVSINLSAEAVEKIKARGLEAILCRAEQIALKDINVDLFTCFQMLEHLHNPAIFLRRLAKKGGGRRVVITVPYLKRSRVGLQHIRNRLEKTVDAEMEHIFELSPEDWTLLMLHSGWRVVDSDIYYQYPRRWPLLREIFALFWRKTDFEGFWGAILEKDLTFSDRYKDWEDD